MLPVPEHPEELEQVTLALVVTLWAHPVSRGGQKLQSR